MVSELTSVGCQVVCDEYTCKLLLFSLVFALATSTFLAFSLKDTLLTLLACACAGSVWALFFSGKMYCMSCGLMEVPIQQGVDLVYI